MTPHAVSVDEIPTIPLVEGGANFRSFGLRPAGPRRLVLAPTLGARLLQAGFLLFGGASLLASAAFLLDSEPLGFALALVIGTGLLATALLLRRHGRPFVVDRASGRWWRGGKRPPPRGKGVSGRLSDVRAIQILYKRVSSNDSEDAPFDCYELNLVLAGSARVSLCAHADIGALRGDAARIARLIGVEVVDQT